MNPHERRLLDIPEIERTERLILRVPRPGDGPISNQAQKESHDRLREWFPWAVEIDPLDDAELVVRSMHVNFWNRDAVVRFIVLPETNTMIGTIGLHSRKWDPIIMEIGYWLRTGYEGRGYVSEALQACLKIGFETFHADKIIIRADHRNQRSQNVALRNGFTLDGIMRHYEPVHKDPQQMTDMCFFSLMRRDYEKMKGAA